MAAPSLNFVNCPHSGGEHRMAYWLWGDERGEHTIVCVHGLSRQGRDFDVLARTLVERAGPGLRVVCPDVVGRGRSDWLSDPAGYQMPTYVADMVGLLVQLRRQAPMSALDWVGTSMGGLIGLAVAGTPDLPLPADLRRLVLNDVGPVLQWQALQRIGAYLGKAGRFSSVAEAAAAMLVVSAGFGPHTPEQWMALSEPMVRALPDGGYALHYDPAIAQPFAAVTRESAQDGEAMLWTLYDAIRARTLLVRGAESDLLTRETALEMTQRGPRAQLVEFAGVGHAPTFVAQDQLDLVCRFLLEPETDVRDQRSQAASR